MIRFLLKTVAVLVGLPLSLGGFFGFFFALYIAFGEDKIGEGLGLAVLAIIALAVGTKLGKFARGDYD